MVGRVSITNLNDIASGEHYSAESGKYFPDGYDESKPYESASVGGGRSCNGIVVADHLTFLRCGAVGFGAAQASGGQPRQQPVPVHRKPGSGPGFPRR